MCGIFGIVSASELGALSGHVQRAVESVNHRGPDDEGYLTWSARDTAGAQFSPRTPAAEQVAQAGVFLAHKRLSILDLSPSGRQPMGNPSGDQWIVYNGEIYNYVELRRQLQDAGRRFRSTGDTEVILQAYEEWGDRCVERFNGIWAFAILDLRAQRLFLARDRFGVKPLHYSWHRGTFAFSSEIKQLVSLPLVPRAVNRQAVYEYLVHGSFDHSPQTFFSAVQKLPPGHTAILDLRAEGLRLQCYYRPQPKADDRIGMSEAASRFRELLTDSVRLQLRSDVEVGSCLSGGLDSSSIVSLMSSQLRQEGKAHQQRTFSAHFEEPEANELAYTRQAIAAAGVESHFVYPQVESLLSDLDSLVWHQDEPFGSTSIFSQWCVYRLAREQGVKVLLDGQGADEQLSGYVGFYPIYLAELLASGRLAAWGRESLWYWYRHRPSAYQFHSMLSPRAAAAMRRPSPPAIGWLEPELEEACRGQDSYVENSRATPYAVGEDLNTLLYQMTFANNLPTLLRYADRNSMAFSVEARVPFLDHRLVEFILSLPARLKINCGYTKAVLREGMKGVIPESIRTRVSKLGFATPERRWQAGALRPLITGAIQSERLRPYVRASAAQEKHASIEASGASDFLPWRWLNLDRWLKVYGAS